MKVSIITAVLNGARTIENCLKSVRMQTHMNREHIIIDGGSTDGTIEIIKKHREDIARWVSEPDEGIYDAMNKGIALASGEVVGILNADDFYADVHVLSKVAAVFDDLSVDSCYGNLDYVDRTNTGRAIRHWHAGHFNRNSFYWGWMPPHPTFFARHRIYQEQGLFNPSLGSSADYELMLRFLLRHRISTSYIPGVLIKMLTGGTSNASLRNRIKANRMDRLAWRINGLTPYPWTLYFKPLRKIGQYSIDRAFDVFRWSKRRGRLL